MSDITKADLGRTLSKLLNETPTVREMLPFAMKLTPAKVDAILTGEGNYNLNDMSNFIRMCGGCIEISKWDVAIVNEVDEIRKALIDERKSSEMTITDLAKKSRVSSKIIAAFEEGRGYGLQIDSFLKIINALDIDINVI